MISGGFEPPTVCVLDRRDNQLHQEILLVEEDQIKHFLQANLSRLTSHNL
jgi:hypothetical protein